MGLAETFEKESEQVAKMLHKISFRLFQILGRVDGYRLMFGVNHLYLDTTLQKP